MTLKNNRASLLTYSSFMYHFIAIGEFILELQSGNAQYRSKSMIFFVTCDLEIWQISLKHNRATLLWYFKLCASFRSHRWIYAGVVVRKSPNWGKICFDLWDLDLWPLTMTFCMGIMFVNINNSWKFQDDMMTGTLWKRCDGRTGGRTDGQTDGLMCT